MAYRTKRLSQFLQNPRAAVRCTHAFRSKRYVVTQGENSVCVLKAGCQIVALNDDEIVTTEDGEQLKPQGRFYITAETIDPYHLLLDIF